MGINRCKLSSYKQRKLTEFFVAEVTARAASELANVNYQTAQLFYQKLRKVIAENIEDETLLSGEVEVDESYFGGVRKGKRGRGAAGKVPVFGLLKRGGKVYTKIIEDTSTRTVMPILRQKIAPDSIVYTDSYRSYNALDVSEFKHYRINHSHQFADKHNHINGIENFWNQAKRILRKYNGIPRASFYYFLKGCECRFNYGSTKQQLKTLRQWIKL
jgi:transposase